MLERRGSTFERSFCCLEDHDSEMAECRYVARILRTGCLQLPFCARICFGNAGTAANESEKCRNLVVRPCPNARALLPIP